MAKSPKVTLPSLNIGEFAQFKVYTAQSDPNWTMGQLSVYSGAKPRR